MTLFAANTRLNAVFLLILLCFPLQGADSELLVSPAGPTKVDALAGSNVTLAVSFSGAPDPALTWFMKDLPVVTWTINSASRPDIAENKSMVLGLEEDGSLTFRNVSVACSSDYTVEMTKSGLGTSSITFTLKVFEIFQGVALSTQPGLAVEGADRLTLLYDMQKGVVERQTWFFHGTEINTNSHYSVEERSLVILGPDRNDTGQYTLVLSNPFSSATANVTVTVRYGPDEPRLEAHPAQPFYVSGDSLSLSCQAGGFPEPTAEWSFGGQMLSGSSGGVLNITNVQSGQGGVYTCTLINQETKKERKESIDIKVYEIPIGSPVCSVQSVSSVDVQYHCQWLGGIPDTQLSFPALSNTSTGAGDFGLTVTATDNLNGKTITCVAEHPTGQKRCNITARSPADFLPAVRTSVDDEGKIVVAIHCVSEAAPEPVVSWSRDGEALASGSSHHISSDTTQLTIQDYNVSRLLHNYTCVSRNALGSRRRKIHLREPAISDSSLFPNDDGTIVTLTWEVPPASVVTGFDIQLKGPELESEKRNDTEHRGDSDEFRTIQQKPGSARSADIFILDPAATYKFRVIPKARMVEGVPSEVHRIGPGNGLSGPAIAGIAAGIPCSLLFLFLVGLLIYCLVDWNKNKRGQQTRYPVSRAIEKVMTTQIDAPHMLHSGGPKSSTDYSRYLQTPSEISVALPNFVPAPPVRTATRV